VATVLFRPHLVTFNFFTLLGLAITLCEHSGYNFVDSGSFHDLHHKLHKTRNLGLLGTFDHVFRTRAYPKPRRADADAGGESPGSGGGGGDDDDDDGDDPDGFLVSRTESG